MQSAATMGGNLRGYVICSYNGW